MELILIAAIVFCVFSRSTSGLVAVVVAGLMVDVWNGSMLGVTSFGLLLLGFGINLYKRKFNPENIWFLTLFSFFSLGVYYGIQTNSVAFHFSLVRDLFIKVFIVSLGIIIVHRIWIRRFGEEDILN